MPMEPPREANDPKENSFQRAFGAIAPLIREEWPGVDEAALEATGGDFDKVTTLIAAHLDRTRVAVRRQLEELHAIAVRAPQPGPAKAASNGASSPVDELLAAVRRLEALAGTEARKVSGVLLPKAQAKVKENLWISLLIALMMGLVFGLWMNGGRRGGRGG